MSRKLTFAVAAALLASGVAAAQSQSPFPMSVNEAGPYEPETYYAPSGSPAATPAIVESDTFPVSVSESGLNDPDIYATRAPAAAQPSHAALLAASKFGSRGEAGTAAKTVRVEPSTRYINVSHFDQVRLVDPKGQSFTWKFDTLDETKFPLTAIAPPGFDATRAVVYVTHPQSHVATD